VDPGEIQGVAITSLGRRHYGEAVLEKFDPRGRPYYWFGGNDYQWVDEEGTDIAAIHQKEISVTPLHMDLTDYDLVAKMGQWQMDFQPARR
jgi:5'-nucleotidase